MFFQKIFLLNRTFFLLVPYFFRIGTVLFSYQNASFALFYAGFREALSKILSKLLNTHLSQNLKFSNSVLCEGKKMCYVGVNHKLTQSYDRLQYIVINQCISTRTGGTTAMLLPVPHPTESLPITLQW